MMSICNAALRAAVGSAERKKRKLKHHQLPVARLQSGAERVEIRIEFLRIIAANHIIAADFQDDDAVANLHLAEETARIPNASTGARQVDDFYTVVRMEQIRPRFDGLRPEAGADGIADHIDTTEGSAGNGWSQFMWQFDGCRQYRGAQECAPCRGSGPTAETAFSYEKPPHHRRGPKNIYPWRQRCCRNRDKTRRNQRTDRGGESKGPTTGCRSQQDARKKQRNARDERATARKLPNDPGHAVTVIPRATKMERP